MTGPIIRRFVLPGGREIVSIRPDVFERALAAANKAMRNEAERQAKLIRESTDSAEALDWIWRNADLGDDA